MKCEKCGKEVDPTHVQYYYHELKKTWHYHCFTYKEACKVRRLLRELDRIPEAKEA